MRGKIENILKNYRNEILDINESDLSVFTNIESGIKISRKYLQKLRFVLREGQFKNKEDEIYFFKTQKPFIYGHLKFYAKYYKFLLQKPRGTNKSKRVYIDLEIKKLQEYHHQNINFIQYNRRNSSNLDEFYFLRGNDNLGLISDTSHFYTDAEFSTSHDNAVAKIMAYDLLLNQYTKELENLKKSTNERKSDQNFIQDLNLKLLANKVDIVELIYALVASGSIKGDIKDLAIAFEKIFDIDLGNFYRTFIEIRARKTDASKFLDHLKLHLLKKIEEADE